MFSVLALALETIHQSWVDLSGVLDYLSVGTGPNGAVAMSPANGLVGTGFASRYRLQPREDF